MAALPARLTARAASRRPRNLWELRLRLDDGAETTLHVAAYDRALHEVGVVRLGGPAPLAAWCASRGVGEALIGGFFTRPAGCPLGELRTRGVLRSSTPFTAPWDAVRACVHVSGGELRLARRDALPAQPAGDLLQAGPLLLDGGATVLDGDPEGFSAGAHQFDSDITDGRHPRARWRSPAAGSSPRSATDATTGRPGSPSRRWPARCGTSARPTRSTSTAAARRRSSAQGACATARANRTASPSPAAARSRRRWSSARGPDAGSGVQRGGCPASCRP